MHLRGVMKIYKLLLILLVCSAACISALSQTTGATLSGTVEDEKGAVIPGVRITIANPATGLERNVQTDSSGTYIIPLLPPGTYTITAEQTGFKRVQYANVVLNVNDQRSLRIHLAVGSVEAAIEVRAQESLITDSPAVATTIDQTFVSNLPLNGRSFQSLILLTPGVVATNSGSQTSPGQFSVNGQRSNANYFTVDGVSVNAGVDPRISSNFREGQSQFQAGTVPAFTALGGTNNLVSVDALEEFKIQTSTYAAEFGRQPGGQIQLATRSGKNDFHGTAFEYVRNEAFDANNWFTNSRTLTAQQVAQGITRAVRIPLRQNQFGGTFSGPIIVPGFGEGGKRYRSGRNRSFFFFSYEGLQLLLPQSGSGFVPSLRIRQIAAPSVRPFLNAFALPTGPEVLSSIGQPLAFSPVTFGYSNPSDLSVWSVRFDHKVTDRLSLFGRYNDSSSSTASRATNQLTFLSTTTNEDRSVTLGSTWLIGPNLTNELKMNYVESHGTFLNKLDDFGGATPIDPALLTAGYSGGGVEGGGFAINFTGLAAQQRISTGKQADSFQRQLNIVNNTTRVAGAHVFKFGVDYRRLAPIYGPADYSRTAIFTGESALVSGIANNLNISSFKGSRPIFKNFSAYAQDTWKISRRLTLDLGARWEINPAPTEATGLQPILIQGFENLPTASLAPAGTPIFKTFWTAVAPRFGISYLLFQKPGRETVLRGGFGVYYDLGTGPTGAAFYSYPFLASVARTNVPFPVSAANAAVPAFPQVTLPITSSLSAVNPGLKLPYTLQWNVALQQSLGAKQAVTISYVGNASRRLLTSQTHNQPQNGTSGPRPNPNFGEIMYTTNGPTSDYHALQTQYQRRLTRGLQALVSYTWAHAIDEVSIEAFDYSLLRGNSDFDVRHNLSAAATYQLPRILRDTFLDPIFRDWSVDMIIHAQSGYPVDVFGGTSFSLREDGSRLRVRPDVIPGVPLYTQDPNVAGGRRFNSAAFVAVPNRPGTTVPSRPGSLGRNVLRELPIYQVDLALGRKFPMGEKWRVELKGEVFNVSNHPNFALYGGIFTTPSTFGVPSRTLNQGLGGLNALHQIGGPRSMQFSVRISY
jgi:hypothetical protein